MFYIMTKSTEMFIITHIVNPAHKCKPSIANFFLARDGCNIIIIIKAICNTQDPLKKSANVLSGS